ncbi:hypothetical protein ABI59_15425 [Acidobacteria bacterium Mor1]|nr:hypothetical protein ABI59_15425 [Acidobacteria bacterium Mor1]
MRRLPTLLALGLMLLCSGCLDDQMLQNIKTAIDPSEGSTPADGLREALRVGTERAVDSLGRTDGYLASPELKIGVPDDLEKLAKALRTLGAGDVVEEFETSLNRAAESAAPLAREVFWNAIREMTIEDAMTIIKGKGHEATDYLRTHAEPVLVERFRPIVSRELDSVGATKDFNELVDRANSLPFVDKPVFDLPDYVTGEALGGLWKELGKEEERIREDPLARTTELLRKYFGNGS